MKQHRGNLNCSRNSSNEAWCVELLWGVFSRWIYFLGQGTKFLSYKKYSYFLLFTFLCSLISQLNFHICCSWYLFLLRMVDTIPVLEELLIKKEKRYFEKWRIIWLYGFLKIEWLFLKPCKKRCLTECRFLIILKIGILCFWRYFQLLKSSALPDLLLWI